MNREKNMDNFVKNVYIVTPSSKDDIIFKSVYVNEKQFELQILRKRDLTYQPRFAYFQILDFITIEPNNTSTINHTIEVDYQNINLIFQYKILKNIYDMEWSVKDSMITLKIDSKNGDKIKSPIKLLLLRNIKYEIKDDSLINIK